MKLSYSIYSLLLLTFLFFGCEKEKIAKQNDTKDVTAVLASYGYKPVKDLPSDVKIPASMSLDEFKKMMKEEEKANASSDFNIESGNKAGRTTANVTDITSGPSQSVQSGNFNYIIFRFARLKANLWPSIYQGSYSVGYGGFGGSLEFEGFNASTTWLYQRDMTGDIFNNHSMNTGLLNKILTVSGVTYQRNFRVIVELWFHVLSFGQLVDQAKITIQEI